MKLEVWAKIRRFETLAIRVVIVALLIVHFAILIDMAIVPPCTPSG